MAKERATNGLAAPDAACAPAASTPALVGGKDEGSAVPPQARGSWSSFLKSIASFNGDFSTMTAPPFILSTTSLVEFSTYWAEHPAILVAPAGEKDPAKRAMLVLKWFLSTLKQQYSSRNEKLGSEKKPLNPFLGELFLGKWEDAAGVTQLVSEQVSHHPPVTAYSIWNSKHGVRLQGYNAQKASFARMTINVKQIGHAILHIDEYDEDYLFTLPSLHIEGLLSGSPFIELNGSSYMQSSSGYTAKIDYSGRGWITGKKNTFTATLYPEGKEKEILYKVDGQWNTGFEIKDAKKNLIDSYTARTTKTTPLTVAPIEDQGELESRRAWKKVAEAIEKGDMDTTSVEKTKIEESQRALRRQEKAEDREWERRYFSKAETHPIFESLGSKVGAVLDSDKTNGVWRFDVEKAKKVGVAFQDEVSG